MFGSFFRGLKRFFSRCWSKISNMSVSLFSKLPWFGKNDGKPKKEGPKSKLSGIKYSKIFLSAKEMAQKMELLPKAKQPGIYPGQKRKKPSKYAKFRNPGELFRVKGKSLPSILEQEEEMWKDPPSSEDEEVVVGEQGDTEVGQEEPIMTPPAPSGESSTRRRVTPTSVMEAQWDLQRAKMEELYNSYFPVKVREHDSEEAPEVASFTPYFPGHSRPRNFTAIVSVPPQSPADAKAARKRERAERRLGEVLRFSCFVKEAEEFIPRFHK